MYIDLAGLCYYHAALGLRLNSHMLERQERTLARLRKVNIEDVLFPSITLLSDLIKFLNSTKTRRGKGIVAILEKMLEIDEMTNTMDGLVWADLSLEKSDPEKFHRQWEVEERVAWLNRELRKYRFLPRAAAVIGGNSGADRWIAYFRGDPREKTEERLRLAPSEALQVILKLTQIGYLNRLRHCTHCQRWLYATFRHQKFCSTKCQQKSYTQSDEWKAHRRNYMRRRYQRLMKNYRKRP